MDPIAIVGFSFRFPQGAEDETSFWDLLERGKNVMTQWPVSRANVDAYRDKQSATNILRSRGGHFVDGDPNAFDAPFFSITSKEASSMDPQQRWLMEATYRALENAGIPLEKAAGTDTGVFTATMNDDWHKMVYKDPDNAPVNVSTGIGQAMLANRLSWFFDLRGPSVTLNTACSSSMIATDLACQSLLGGQSSMALVAASNPMLTPESSTHLENMNFLSQDSLSYSFDSRANGYARGEGVVVLVLKRLSQAIQDGDKIRAIIRASRTNQDGHTPGITQPSQTAQEALIQKIYKSCNLDFSATRYVETHGTGTQIGDSTEARALGRVFRTFRSAQEPLYIGSVKANIGHLEGASALAGIIKAVMVLERGIIPPNPLFQKWNPKINAKLYNLNVPTSCVPWPSAGLRRISINSFGFGGSNGHLVLDDALNTLDVLGAKGLVNAPQLKLNGVSNHFDHHSTNGLSNGMAEKLSEKGPKTYGAHNQNLLSLDETETNGANTISRTSLRTKPWLLVWSATDEAALDRVLQSHVKYCESHSSHPDKYLGPLAYTLSARRSLMSWRSFAIVQNSEAGAVKLSPAKGARSFRDHCLAFVFTGQGAQYARMGLDLIAYPVFYRVLAQAEQIFAKLGASWSLIDEIQNEVRINSPEMSQPLCTVLQIGLVELFREMGVVPDAVVGHSSGEIAAAYTVGALSLESACRVSYYRGLLAQKIKDAGAVSGSGAMISVNIPEANVDAYLAKTSLSTDISLACINSPFNVTLSGSEVAINKLQLLLDQDEIFARKLNTGVAYHSSAMHQIADEYLAHLGELEPRCSNSNIVMSSSVTGDKISPSALTQGQYWVDNLVSPVCFADALGYLADAAPKVDGLKPITHYIEIGPHAALKRSITDTLQKVVPGKGSHYLSILSKFENPLDSFMQSVGNLFSHGYPVSVTATNQQHGEKSDFLVDTPGYPFNRTLAYSCESRLSRDWRLREYTPGDLLGMTVADWNPLEPRWRKFLRVSEMPWLQDHVVGGNCLFPATGSLGIALEAVTQLAHSRDTIVGFHIKEATFMAPIMIRPEEDNEIITCVRPLQQSYEKAALRFKVEIFTVVEQRWTRCVEATIKIEHEEAPNTVTGDEEARYSTQELIRNFTDTKKSCNTPIEKRFFYQKLLEHGFGYGKAFALADDLYWDDNDTAISKINVEPPMSPFKGVVSPALLDAICHVTYIPPTQGCSKTLPTTIPHKISNAWIASKGWQYPETREVRVVATSKVKPQGNGLDCSIKVLGGDSRPLCYMQKLEMQLIMSNQAVEEVDRRLLHRIEWKPQLSLLDKDQLAQYCNMGQPMKDVDSDLDGHRRLVNTISTHMQQTLHQVEDSRVPLHIHKYVNLMKELLAPYQDTGFETVLNRGAESRSSSYFSELITCVSNNLGSILCGDVDPSGVLLPAVEELHENLFRHFRDHRVIRYLELVSHETPTMRILELGGGSGALTSLVLSVLEEIEHTTGGVAFSEYVFTDVLDLSFEHVERKFPKYKSRLTFQTLDTAQDIPGQGIQAASFDLVLAGGSILTSRRLSAHLQNVKELIKPGGHIFMCQSTNPNDVMMNFGLGALPDWCGDEPILKEEEWNCLLQENGFSGNDLVIHDSDNEETRHTSIIASTVLRPLGSTLTDPQTARIILVINQEDEVQKSLASTLTEGALNQSQCQILTVSMPQTVDLTVYQTDYIVFLADLDGRLLMDISESAFDAMKQLLTRSGSLVWITSLDRESGMAPYAGIKDGLLRTIRAEFTSKHIVAISLESRAEDVPTYAPQIGRIFSIVFMEQSPELEFSIRQGHISVARLVEDTHLDDEISSSVSPKTKTSPWLPGPALKLDIGTRGELETLYYTLDERFYNEDIGPLEVEIEAKSWAVNFRDVFGALGRLPEQPGFGMDCAGVVRRVGSQVTSLGTGDRVCMSALDCMRMYPRGNEWQTLKIPDSTSFSEASAIITPGLTAWHCLVEVGRLQRGEKILIHGASGATGQLAIQVAQNAGAEIFVTVGFDYKKQLLIDEYGIDPDHIFYSRSNNVTFAKGIMRMTNGYGVDMVLNSLVGESLRASWECIAPYGRFIEIGKTDINMNSSLPMGQFARNATFSSVDIRHLLVNHRERGSQLLQKVVELAANGTIHHPKPLHVYSVGDVEDAFRYIQGGQNSGRVVIQIEPDAEVKKHLITRRDWEFDAEASYLVVGGFGGVGRSILEWMASRGAKNLIIPVRSDRISEPAAKVIKELQAQNVNIVTTKCDVASQAQLTEAMDKWRETAPAIRGCINAAMVLNDSVFENMSHRQWSQTLRSKTQTTWNLHTLLPDVDFMVFLSSVSGVIGNPGQANYAAGCTFQDALAHYRNVRGYKSTSIDLGPMRDIGIIAENQALRNHYDNEKKVFGHIEKNELLALLDICCDPAADLTVPGPQLICGVGTPVEFSEKSLEVPEMLNRPLFGHFSLSSGANLHGTGSSAENFSVLFREAKTTDERINLVARCLAKKLARALLMEAEDIDLDKALHAYGVDSLVAVELRNWITKEFLADIPVFEIMSGRTVKAVAELVEASSQVGK